MTLYECIDSNYCHHISTAQEGSQQILFSVVNFENSLQNYGTAIVTTQLISLELN